jgi:hypothetical protein
MLSSESTEGEGVVGTGTCIDIEDYDCKYTIELKPSTYYKWTMSYDKIKCKWSKPRCEETTSPGSATWQARSNDHFCIFNYFTNVENDPTPPCIPSEIGYPNEPSTDFCNVQYMKWRIVKTSSFVGEPFAIEIVDEIGNGRWEKVTPFEYEIIQDKSIFCIGEPQPPSNANSTLKHDSEDLYRAFTARWRCGEDSIEYVSGPTYAGTTASKGNNRWEYNDKSTVDANLGQLFELDWVSSSKGYGTSPNTTIDSSVLEELISICFPEATEEEVAEIVDGTVISNEEVEDEVQYALPTFRVVYDCSTKTFDDIETIALTSADDDEMERNNRWTYYQSFEDNGIEKCLFYYLSNEIVEMSSDIVQPSTDSVNLSDCPCVLRPEVNTILDNTKSFSVLVSGVVGTASSVNRIYSVSQNEDLRSWSYLDDKTSINLFFENNVWNMNFSNEYENQKKLTITKNLPFDESHIGQLNVIFDSVAIYKDAEEHGRCFISFESDSISDAFDESSSSSNSSSESSITESFSSQSDISSESSTS